MMSVTGTPESGPLKTSYPVVDYSTGLAATAGLATALYQRERTGRGQHIDVSMLETALMLLSPFAVGAINEGTEYGLVGNGSNLGGYIHNAFRCKEGLILIAAQTDLRRGRLWKVLQMTDIHSDPRFATEALCRKNIKELDAEVEKRLVARTAVDWELVLQEAGIPAMCVYSIPEIVRHPQVTSRNFFHKFEFDAELEAEITVPTTSYRLSDSPVQIHSLPPRVGEHTVGILDGLGYSQNEINKFREEGVV